MSGHANQTTLAAITRARLAWGEAMPDWIEHLAIACDRESQSRVSHRIQYSGAVVSHVLKNSYPGNLGKVEASVRRALMSETLDCPALGAITGEACLTNQKAEYQPHDPQAVALFRACRNCVNRITGRN